MRRLVGSIIKAQQVFNLIENGDRIIIGVSGGKDSALLFYALTLYCNKLKDRYGYDIKLFGYCIDAKFKDIDYSQYLKWMKKNHLNLKIINSNIAEIISLKQKNTIVCSFCAKMKKAILVKQAKKLKCNKIAFAHHIDDAIETLFLNMIYEGRIATFAPKQYLDRNKITMIRPFILTNEKDIIDVAKKTKLPVIKNMCPNENSTQRTFIKEFLNKNFYNNKLFPNCYKNFRNMLINNKGSELWFTNLHKNKNLLSIIKAGKTKLITNN